jgi:hypothetical protein
LRFRLFLAGMAPFSALVPPSSSLTSGSLPSPLPPIPPETPPSFPLRSYHGGRAPPRSTAPAILGAIPGSLSAGGGWALRVGSIVCNPTATVLGAHVREASSHSSPSSRGSYNGDGNVIRLPEILSPFPRVGFNLDSLLGYFWVRSRVSTSSSTHRAGESFGWWRDKVSGDSRTFAQVVAAPTSSSTPTATSHPSLVAMGDRGGGHFHPGWGSVGHGRFDGGRGNVWHRNNEAPQSSSSAGAGFSMLFAGSERWDAKAATDKQGRDGYKSLGGVPPPATNNQVLCPNCNMSGHFVVRCPTIRSERCKKLGHISQFCQTALPWDCIAPTCGFQKPRQGFFISLMIVLLIS